MFTFRVVAIAFVVSACGGDAEVQVAPEATPTVAPVESGPDDGPIGSVDAATVAAAADDRARRGIDTYSYRVRISNESFEEAGFSGCGATGGTLVVEISEGEIERARMEDLACSIEPDATDRLPLTAAELYDHTIELMAVAPFVELDIGPDGFPNRIFAEFETGYFEFELLDYSIGDVPQSSDDGELTGRLAAARAQWERLGVDSYTLETKWVCLCDPG